MSRLSSHEGMNAEQLPKRVLLRLIEDNERFLAAVQIGIDQADRREFVSPDEVTESALIDYSASEVHLLDVRR